MTTTIDGPLETDFGATMRTRTSRAQDSALMGLSVFLSTPAVFNMIDPRIATALVGVASGAVCLRAIRVAASTKREASGDMWLTPAGLYWIVCLITFGIAPSYLALASDPLSPTASEAVVVGLVWVWCTMLAWRAAASRMRFRPPTLRFNGLSERFPGAGVVAWIMGGVATAYLVAVGRFSFVSGVEAARTATSSIPQLAYQASFGLVLGSILVLHRGLATRSSYWTSFGVALMLASGLIALFGGTKESVLVVAFAAAATYRVTRGRLPTGAMLASAVLVILLFLVVSPYRQAVRYQGLDPMSAFGFAVAETTREGGPLEAAADGADRVLSRFGTITSLQVILLRTPSEIPYRDLIDLPGRTASILIPRSLWPSKPIVDDGRDFAIEYLDRSTRTDTSVAVTLVGDAYRQGGYATVVLFAAAVGVYVALLDRAASPLRNSAGILVVLAMAVDLAQAEGSLATTIAGQATAAVVVAAMMIGFLSRDLHRTPSRNGAS